jgi:N-acyl homoserine lactone hydrolase
MSGPNVGILFSRLKRRAYLVLALACAIAIQAAPASAAPQAPSLQLYTLDCGHLHFSDAGAFADTGEHEGEGLDMAAPCYLVRHDKDWMLWDTGLGDRIAAEPQGEIKFGGKFTVRITLAAQLSQLGLRPDDVHYVALSHLHSDHSGNIGLFPNATFIVAPSELAWARSVPTPAGVEKSLIQPLDHARISATDGDVDVFGDGSVRLLSTPGHTPGHRSLLVRLAKSGPLLISGDLYHTRENYEKGLVPRGNTERADTLASFKRFAGIRDNTHARVIIQHSPADFAAMPAFPRPLD